MPSGTSDSPLTTKTEFARYLDSHPESVPSLRVAYLAYKNVNPKGVTFGFWLRCKRYPDFSRTYANWWLKRPSLYGKVYAEPSEDLLAVSVYR